MMGAANHWIVAALLGATAVIARLSPAVPQKESPVPSLPVATVGVDAPRNIPATPSALLERIASAPPGFSGQSSESDTPALALESMRLVGVVIGDRGAIALFTGPDNSTTAVSRGGDISGWTVISLSARGVRLKHGETIIEREVFAPRTPDGSPPPAVAPPSMSEDRDLGTRSNHEPASAPPATFSAPPPLPVFGPPKG